MKARQGARGRAVIGVTFGGCVVVAAWLAVVGDNGEEAARELIRKDGGIRGEEEEESGVRRV